MATQITPSSVRIILRMIAELIGHKGAGYAGFFVRKSFAWTPVGAKLIHWHELGEK